MPKVSVVIPVYGVEKYIADTVQSVLIQTYQDFEILIIDDGSPDRSVEICKQFNDPRIKILPQQNRGLAGARNTGIRVAKGEYFALLDGDDLWLPEKLEKHIQHLEKSPEVGISFSRAEFINESGDRLGTYLMPKLKDISILDLFRGSPLGNGSTPVIRRQVFEDIKFQDNLYGTLEDFYFDEHFRRSEDIECWIRILLTTSWKIEGIPESLTLYRINSGGLSANLLKQLESWEQVLAKTKTYAPDLISRWQNMAMAYQYRYLGRSAIRLKDGEMAMKLLNRAIVTYFPILWEEPKRTLRFLLAAYSLFLLPQGLYNQIEDLTAKVASFRQRNQIFKDQLQDVSS